MGTKLSAETSRQDSREDGSKEAAECKARQHTGEARERQSNGSILRLFAAAVPFPRRPRDLLTLCPGRATNE